MKTAISKYTLAAGFIAFCLSAFAQQPLVNSLSQYNAPAGATIFINGTGFNANCQVDFGGGVATVSDFTATQMEVIVPSNAIYAPVTVTNTTSGLSSSSKRPFTLAFGGSGAIDSDNFDTQVNLDVSGVLMWDLCLCQLDDDADLDVVSTSRQSGQIEFSRNITGSTDTNVQFNTPASISPSGSNPVTTGANTDGIICDDLDGDGKRDIIITTVESSSPFHVRIYPNNYAGATMTLGTAISFKLPNNDDGTNRSASRLALADLDQDGKKDLIVASEQDPSLFIYLNTSTVGNVSVNATPFKLTLSDLDRATLVNAGELNGDGVPDLAVASNVTGQIALVKNISSPGKLNFEEPTLAGNSTSRTVMKLGDFDNDGLMDLAYSSNSGNRIAYLQNTTSSPNDDISMGAEQSFSLTQAYGVDLGDINGDGLVDIAASSLTTGLRLYRNTSSGSTISFAGGETIEVETIPAFSTQNAARNIKLADVNTDGKPDLIFTFNSRDGQPGKLSVIANRSPLTFSIEPDGLTFCQDSEFYLQGPFVTNATYSWSRVDAGGTLTFDPASQDTREMGLTLGAGHSGSVQIKLDIQYAGETDIYSDTKTFSINNASPPTATINVVSDGGAAPYCGGENITLSSANTADDYLWTLPDGSQVTTTSVSITDAGEADAGIYILQIANSASCYSTPDTLNLDIEIPPSLTITNEDGGIYFCEGNTITLAVPDYSGFDYEWFKDGVTTDSTNATINVLDSGNYTLQLTSQGNNCTTESESFEVFAIDAPSAMIDASTGICVSVPMTFTATSTANSNFTMTHTWDFKDGSATETGASIEHTFSTAGTYDVEISSAYNEIDMCEDIITLQVTVSDVPTITIDAVDGLEKCASDSVRLELPQNYQSYSWSTGDTTYFTYATTQQGETAVTISADVVTDIGCTTTTEDITVSNYSGSGTLTITPTGISNSGDTIALESNVSSVELTADVSGGTNYTWTSSDPNALSITEGNVTTVFPRESLTTVTASANGANDCIETRTIYIRRPGLQAQKSFSPNGDGINDCWEITNSENAAGCTLYIFDSRGRIIHEANSPFENDCAWDGTTNNSNESYKGIYYFVLKCSETSSSQTGTILLAK